MIYPHVDELYALIQQKYVSKRKHPDHDLWIYNYTKAAQYGFSGVNWPPVICDARGLVLDANHEIVGRGFQKFFNLEWHQGNVPQGPCDVYEKLDGVLILAMNYRSELVIATRGSFESQMALWAQRWFRKHHPGFLPSSGLTYCFEGIAPQFRIVVDYGKTEKCILLGVLDENAHDIDSLFAGMDQFERVKKYPFTDPKTLHTIENNKDEGFVCRWKPISGPSFRAKIKFSDYTRLARFQKEMSPKNIWDLLRNGTPPQELLDRAHPIQKPWLEQQITALQDAYKATREEARRAWLSYTNIQDRKELARAIKNNPYWADIFAFYDQDEKTLDRYAWSRIRPKANQVPKWEFPDGEES